MFIALGLGKKKHPFPHMRTVKSTPHTHKWEGELQATVKEVHLESRLERRVSFPEAPWQGIPLERAVYMKAHWPYRFVQRKRSS